MTSPPPLPPVSGTSGEEAARLVVDVLRDQAERSDRRTPGPAPRPPRSTRWLLCAALAAVSAWLWLAPPAALAPPPVEPAPEVLETGLRMELYVTAMEVERFRERQGRLPASLDELDEEVEPWIVYRIAGQDAYRLSGRLGDREVEWSSTQPLSDLAGRRPGPFP